MGAQLEKERQQADINAIQALSKSSEAMFASGERGNALIEALRVNQKVKLASWATLDTQEPTTAALRQAVYLQDYRIFRIYFSLHSLVLLFLLC